MADLDTNRMAVLILTFNESLHLRRAIESVKKWSNEIYVIDSYSTDGTVEIARESGAVVYQNPFIDHSTQVQWAIDTCDISSDWILRLDADEYLTEELGHELNSRLGNLEIDCTGVVLKRRLHFMGKWIRHGGYYPVKLLRVWRRGAAFIEQRLMDEHVVLKYGHSVEFDHDLIDENLNNLNWWTAKHNKYALREAIDLLNSKYHFFEGDNLDSKLTTKEQAARKRWIKSNLYIRAPLFLRAFLYFNYRYWIQLGFLDGTKGLVWHFLQGCWYRFLVDAIIFNIEFRARTGTKDVRTVIEEDYGYSLVKK